MGGSTSGLYETSKGKVPDKVCFSSRDLAYTHAASANASYCLYLEWTQL